MAVKRFGLIFYCTNSNSMELQLISKSDVHKINIPVYCITRLNSTKLSDLTDYDGNVAF